jgi:hypothetical protein
MAVAASRALAFNCNIQNLRQSARLVFLRCRSKATIAQRLSVANIRKSNSVRDIRLVSYRRQVDSKTVRLQDTNANGMSLIQLLAPFSFAMIILLPMSGCCSIVFEPMTNMQAVCSMSAMELVIAPEPNERESGHRRLWHSRAQ